MRSSTSDDRTGSPATADTRRGLRLRPIVIGCLAALALCATVAVVPSISSGSTTTESAAADALEALLNSHRDDPLVIPAGYTDEDVEQARIAVRAGAMVSHEVWSAWMEGEAELDFDIDEDLVFFDTAIRTVCGDRAPNLGPFYCSADDRIYYPDQFAVSAAARWGNWSNVWFAAHEYGHNIQYDSNQGVVDGEPVLAWEQQADCQSGAVVGYLLENDLISNTEVAEMLEAIEYVGDTHEIEDNAADAHGSSAERVAVFYRGLNGWSCGLSSFR